jgi:hypothetical protein
MTDPAFTQPVPKVAHNMLRIESTVRYLAST